jgi:hypothetical protein
MVDKPRICINKYLGGLGRGVEREGESLEASMKRKTVLCS